MELFIRRLPESVTRLDLIHFLSGGVRHRWNLFAARTGSPLVNCEIYRLVNLEDGTVEFHGIAHLESKSAAMAAIEKLDGALLKGKPMEVREFIHRSAVGDRRHRGPSTPSAKMKQERRRENRRREHLLIEELHAGATGTRTGSGKSRRILMTPLPRNREIYRAGT